MNDTPLSRSLRGAGAGAAATIAMSAPMLAAQRLGLMGRQPPEAIAAAVTGDPDSKKTDVLAVAGHLAFGAGSGALYGLAAGRRAGPLTGLAYALGVWAASYQGWLPALGILPPADRDRPGRPAAMIVAHLVFGGTLGRLLRQGVHGNADDRDADDPGGSLLRRGSGGTRRTPGRARRPSGR
jgi:hypothetical protein